MINGFTFSFLFLLQYDAKSQDSITFVSQL